MRAFLTGASGFVGRWLRSHLEERGDEVVVGVDLAEVRSADQAVCADGRATVVFRLEAAAQTETGTGEGGAG